MTELKPFDDERLSAYLDDELSRDEREQFEQFIKDRPDYRQAMDELQTMRSRLKALPTAELGSDFADHVLRKAETATLIGNRQTDKATLATSQTSRSTWTQSRVLAIAGVLAASLLALLILPARLSKQPSVAMVPAVERGDEPSAELRLEAAREASAETLKPESMAGDVAEFSLEAHSVTAGNEAAAQPFGETYPAQPTADMTFHDDSDEMGGRGAGAGYDHNPDATATRDMAFASIEDPDYQQLASQAHELFQTLEPESSAGGGWDVVFTTELRSAQDWNGLKAALATNSITLVSTPAMASANFAQTASESDAEMVETEDAPVDVDSDWTIQQDSEIFNQKLQLPVVSAPTVKRSHQSAADSTRRKQNSDAVPTHLLYVEGTRSQLGQLVDELSVSQSNQILEVVQHQAFQRSEMRQRTKNEPLQEKLSKAKSISPGRAIHLGQSPMKRTAKQNPKRDLLQVRAAHSSLFRNSSPADEAEDQTLIRGLIILQDVSEPLAEDKNESPSNEPSNAGQ